MSLEHIIGHLGTDAAFFLCSIIADNGSSYFCAEKLGYRTEQNPVAREGMIREGAGKYLLKDLAERAGFSVLALGAAYALDSLLKIRESGINIHHVAAYGLGTLNYLAAMSNTANLIGLRKLARVIGFPIQLMFQYIGTLEKNSRTLEHNK